MGQKLPGPTRRYSPPLKGSPFPKISKKLTPRKIYHFKILHLPLISGGSDPDNSVIKNA